MDAPGKGMLKVVSILFIIFGAIATIVSIIAIIGSAVLTAYTVGFGAIFLVGSILLLIVSVLELIIGIIGLKKCADPSQAGFFIVTGIVLVVLGLVSMFLTISNFQVTSLISFILPILYIVGGYMNKNAKTA